MTSFKDIFKSSFLENVTAVSLPDMAIALALSFCLGLFIYFVYKKTYAGVMFSRTFGGSPAWPWPWSVPGAGKRRTAPS